MWIQRCTRSKTNISKCFVSKEQLLHSQDVSIPGEIHVVLFRHCRYSMSISLLDKNIETIRPISAGSGFARGKSTSRSIDRCTLNAIRKDARGLKRLISERQLVRNDDRLDMTRLCVRACVRRLLSLI